MKEEFYEMRSSEQREGLEEMIQWINTIRPTSEMSIIEIGSYVGESTLIFADKFKEVISVDPYVNNYDPNDMACSYAPFDKVYYQFLKNTLSIPNIKSIRDTSQNAFSVLNTQQWDMVYIDGIHTLDGVYYDISNYKNIIRPGGFVCGHDFGWGNVKHNLGLIFKVPIDASFKDGSWIVRV